MSNRKPDHNDDDGLTKEYTNKENMLTGSDLKDCVGFQLGSWWFQTSSKNKVNNTENGIKLEEVCVEIWQQANMFRA